MLARLAAQNFERGAHAQSFRELIQELRAKDVLQDPELFAVLRRKFYRLLLDAAANRELRRHFAAINMQVVYAQYSSARLQAIRIEDYIAICRAVVAGKPAESEGAAKRHVRRVREAITDLAETSKSPLSIAP